MRAMLRNTLSFLHTPKREGVRGLQQIVRVTGGGCECLIVHAANMNCPPT